MINKTIQPKSTKSTKTDSTDLPKVYTKNGNLAADGTTYMRRSTISNEEQTYFYHKNSLLKPFDKEELNIIENRSTHLKAKKPEKIPTWFNGRNGPLRSLLEPSRHWTKSKPEDLYGSLAPTDDDIDEELNLMGTYL
jgi:hypothetical protein